MSGMRGPGNALICAASAPASVPPLMADVRVMELFWAALDELTVSCLRADAGAFSLSAISLMVSSALCPGPSTTVQLKSWVMTAHSPSGVALTLR